MSAKNPTTKFTRLANHVMAMKDDAYLVGHPEWEHIVIDAYRALGKPMPPALEKVYLAVQREKKLPCHKTVLNLG